MHSILFVVKIVVSVWCIRCIAFLHLSVVYMIDFFFSAGMQVAILFSIENIWPFYLVDRYKRL